MSKVTTPQSLARELAVSVDDVLLMLWDGGIDYPTTPSSIIRREHLAIARKACGIVSVKERLSVTYWQMLLNLTPEGFQEWADGKGVKITPGARRLPKGALGKLEKHVPKSRFASTKTTIESVSPVSDLEELQWREFGHTREPLRHLDSAEIEAIHFRIAEDFAETPDPIAPAGVRSRSLLESAASRSSTGMGGVIKYPTVEMAAAAMMHSIIQNHPFFNGNKRTALVSLLAFLDENGLMLECSQDEIFKWTVRVAAHKLGADKYSGDSADNETQLMAQWICSRSRNVESGERVITFIQLKRQLQAHGCSIQMAKSPGGKAVVTRDVESLVNGFFGKKKQMKEKKYHLPFGGEGRQVSRTRIKELRRELHLSEEHGYDSASFYGDSKGSVDAFIAEYRKTLKRLARL